MAQDPSEVEEFEFRRRRDQETSQPEAAKPSRMQTAVSDYMRAIPILGPVGAGFATAAKHAGPLQAELAYKVGGGATDVATHLGASPEVAAGVGLAANVGTQMFPPTPFLAYKAGGAAAAPAMESLARRSMQSALKPNLAARQSDKAERAITTMLDKEINATKGGAEHLQGEIGRLENEIQGVLNSSNATVNTKNIAMELQGAVDKIRRSPYAREEFETIKGVFKRYLDHPEVIGKTDIPVSAANELKRGFNNQVGQRAFGSGDAAKEALLNAERLANKTLGESHRVAVGTAEPKVLPSLREQSELLNALKVLEPRVGVEGNKNLLGHGSLVLNEHIPSSVVRLVTWLADRSPWFKSQLAHTLHSGASRIPGEIAAGSVIAGETAAGRK